MPTFRLSRFLTRLKNDRDGSLMVQFALAGLVLVVLVFGALDLSRASTQKARLLDALDSATLAAALSSGTTNAAVDLVGDRVFLAQLKDSGIAVDASTATFSLGANDTVQGAAESAVSPFITSLFTNDNLPIKVNNTVMRGLGSKVELALVLDTTASMAGAKMTALKTAAKDLVTTLSAKADGNLKIAVIPFGQYVNIGVSRRNQPWANVPADTATPVAGKCTTQTTKQVCTGTEKYDCSGYVDGVYTSKTCTRSTGCSTVPLTPPKTTCTADSISYQTFRGCVGSPAYPKNVQDSDTTRRYPGFLQVNCGAEFTPLTATMASVTSAINALGASGDTYIPAGLAWGFNMLSSPVPMTEAEAYDATGKNLKPRKALVLMTDGQNSMKMNANGTHSAVAGGTRATQADTYTAELCANIKAKKIEVFTVAFQVTDATTKTMLLTCATDSAHYFDATDSAALSAAFKKIGEALRNVYIAQ